MRKSELFTTGKSAVAFGGIKLGSTVGQESLGEAEALGAVPLVAGAHAARPTATPRVNATHKNLFTGLG